MKINTEASVKITKKKKKKPKTLLIKVNDQIRC